MMPNGRVLVRITKLYLRLMCRPCTNAAREEGIFSLRKEQAGVDN